MNTPEGVAPVADRVLGFTVAARHVRGRVVRLDAALNAVLAAHDYPPPLALLLGEALLLTTLLGALLREDEGQLTLQAQASGGAVDLLVCDYRAGAVRGYLRASGGVIPEGGDLAARFGRGHLAITLDPTASAERYQGIVPLEGASLAAAVEGYFDNSEQLPTLVRVAVGWSAAHGWTGGGLLVQHLPRSELGGARLSLAEAPDDWAHIAILAASVTDAELTDLGLREEALLWRLFHEEEVRIVPGPAPVRGCRCSLAHIREVIERFPEAERTGMRRDDGLIGIDCAFCARTFTVAA